MLRLHDVASSVGVVASTALLVVMSGSCASSHGSAAPIPTTSATKASSAHEATTGSPGSTAGAATTTLDWPRVRALVVPTPSGFIDEALPTDRPLTSADFVKYVSTPGGSASFVDGYHQTYESSSSNDFVEIALFEFKTPADAIEFSSQYLSTHGLTATRDTSIAKAQDYDASVVTNGGDSFDHGSLLVSGKRAVLIDYYTSSNARPPDLESIAQQQFNRL